MQKKLRQDEIDKVVQEELIKLEKPELIQIHSEKNRNIKKHKICRKSIKINYPQDRNFLWKLWMKFK